MSDTATSQTILNPYQDLSREQLLVTVSDLAQKLKLTEHQLNWFKRQLFGEKSEKRFIENPNQLGFGIAVLGALPGIARRGYSSRRDNQLHAQERPEAAP